MTLRHPLYLGAEKYVAMQITGYNKTVLKGGKTALMAQNQQERLLAEAQAIVKTYRPIEALVPPHWSQGDVFANGNRMAFEQYMSLVCAFLAAHK